MLSIRLKRGAKTPPLDPGLIPARFKRYVDKKKRKLNDLTPSSKVAAAITKCLVMQGKNDGNNYYIASDTIYCPDVKITEGAPKKPGGPPMNSYSAKGRFKIGKSEGGTLRLGMMEFSVKFRDGIDGMGLPDIVIEEAEMTELPRNAPLQG